MTDELIDEHVSVKQCRLAIDALHKHESARQAKKEETELLSGKEPNVWLNVTVKKIPPGHRIKPVKVPIDYPLIDPRTTPICLITKDPQRQYKDLLETQNIKFISRVVGIEKLKGKFKPFEARRALLKENGMFLADERIIPLLPKLLGKKWFDAKKQPIPVCLTRKDLKGELERAVSSTYMNQNQGTCTSIKIGVLSHNPSQIVANLQKALPVISANIKDGWSNIQSLHIKTNSSVSLPVWSCALDASEEGRWNGLVEEEQVDAVAEDKAEVVEKSAGKRKQASGKKQLSSSDDEEEVEAEEDKPRKRARKADGSVTKPKETKATSTLVKKDSTPTASKLTPQKTRKVKTGTKTDSISEKPAKTKAIEPPPVVSPKAKSTSLTKSKEVVGAKPSASPPASLAKVSKTEAVVSKTQKKTKTIVSLDKKKEKVVKQKGVQSTKSKLLGKKAGQV